MASTKTSLDSAILRGSASQVKNIAGNLENELHSLEQVINTTASSWEGGAKESFERSFQTVHKKHLMEIKSALDQYAKAMETFANANDDLTEKGARLFNIE
ncbi:MAG TPA: WXG100 family type VII secretion target [Candidatus Merdivicinus intestinigallinarum]|nr:WXG100 family type VII secretion target [Candidatus Merdivicinus intestinigallinarum]